MTIPILMLALMILPYVGARWLSVALHRQIDLRLAASAGLVILFVFTGVGHFIQTANMAQMLPPWVPERTLLVYITGILELALAAGFLSKKRRRLAGCLAATLLIAFFPANVYAAIHRIPMGGHEWGPVYLLVRVQLQGAILFWVYWFAIRKPVQS